jgi:predicted  nucleic acid-binding Zn-ribbon protein
MLYLIQEIKLDDNVFDLNDMRRIKGIEKAIKQFEKQIADIKQAKKILAAHTEYRFFSIMCHELTREQKELNNELMKLHMRLKRYKNPQQREENDLSNP